jgi:hypothetical protein
MIVVGTTPGREHWLKDCIQSIHKELLILSDYRYELGKIKWCAEHLTNNFLFLQDSVILKETFWIDKLFAKNKSIALFNDPAIYGTYMGIYEPLILKTMDIPIPKNKAEAVHFEIEWTKKYAEKAQNVEIAFPDVTDAKSTKKELRYGRLNLVLENEYLIKYKGNWGQKPLLD